MMIWRTLMMALAGALALATAACAEPTGGAFKDCEACPVMVPLEPGAYFMGADSRHVTEGPQHLVTIIRPFAIGRYEVTFDEWQACVDDGGCAETPNDHDWGKGKRPIMNITWAESKRYLAWLTKKTGHIYRLPTEAEWEFAARAGTQTNYHWGDELIKQRANCRDCGPEIGHQTEPVGSFPPNPWGLYDVHGNVWEWVEDCWFKTHEGAPGDGSARTEPNCRERVMRSGSWYYFSKNLRSSWRFKNDARVKSYGIGFRAVRMMP